MRNLVIAGVILASLSGIGYAQVDGPAAADLAEVSTGSERSL